MLGLIINGMLFSRKSVQNYYIFFRLPNNYGIFCDFPLFFRFIGMVVVLFLSAYAQIHPIYIYRMVSSWKPPYGICQEATGRS